MSVRVCVCLDVSVSLTQTYFLLLLSLCVSVVSLLQFKMLNHPSGDFYSSEDCLLCLITPTDWLLSRQAQGPHVCVYITYVCVLCVLMWAQRSSNIVSFHIACKDLSMCCRFQHLHMLRYFNSHSEMLDRDFHSNRVPTQTVWRVVKISSS